jgi:DNA-binding CsgD family transcriptional regulator
MIDAMLMKALAELVTAAGTSRFSARFLDTLNHVAPVDLSSAFAVRKDGELHYLFACGDHGALPGFAEEASQAYLRHFWKRDRISRQVFSAKPQGAPVRVLRQPGNAIRDPEYRRACYERANVVERLTFYHLGEPRLLASAYRAGRNAGFEVEECDRLERLGLVLMAALAKHLEILERPASTLRPSPESVAVNLLKSDLPLSRREAEVAGALIAGWTQRDICERTGISLASVVTYRKRAYGKLGVASRRELQHLYNAGLAGMDCQEGRTARSSTGRRGRAP